MFLRSAEGGITGFTEAWAEWVEDKEPPGVMVLEVGYVIGSVWSAVV